MKIHYQPGDGLTLYSEPLFGRALMWLRQFPKPVVCVCLFALGILFCHVFKQGGGTQAAPIPPKPDAQTALSAVPSLDIFKPSKPFLFSGFVPENSTDSAVVRYVERFQAVAQEEADRYGIPASIKLAQGINETDAGRSKLARRNNNHFGVKCFSRTCKKGHCTNFGDDTHKDFFRKYPNAWESWRAHSKMIVSGKYKTLLKYGDDYEKWARGLKKLGYATASHYDDTLIETVRRYHLDDFDK